MLCPNCKQEKWNDPVCPGCGLDPKAAFAALGGRCLAEDRPLEAARAYEALLRLDPEDWDALRQRAIAWYAEAQAVRDPVLFDQADRALAQALEKEWGWEQGHQFRVNLAYTFTRLTDLRRQYQAQAQVPARAEQADRVLK
ncbi:MAG TPA: hypothetical protein VFR02_09325, partial [bacterium]|nr:hypothetical protein [bacterium]